MADCKQNFLKCVLSGPRGTGSTARVCVFLLTVLPLLWVTYLVLRTKAMPELGNVSGFIVVTTTPLYGLNKITAAIAARKDQATC